jgi:putative photosynthetic complex assembly protein
MAALAGLSVIFAAAGGFGLGRTDPLRPALQSTFLHFDDRASGAVLVLDARTDRLIATVEPGEGGFVRATMRGLASERKRRGISDEQPFELQRTVDGHLMLSDPATGRLVALDAFGPTNSAAFARFLETEQHAAAPRPPGDL